MDNGSSGRLVNHEEGRARRARGSDQAGSNQPNCRRIQPRRSAPSASGPVGGGVGSVGSARPSARRSVWAPP